MLLSSMNVRESSVEEALIEMYLAGVSVRRVEDITEALWGTRVSPSTVSNLNRKIYAKIEAWRNRPIEGEYPYVFLDGIVMKRTWAGEVRNVSLLVAIGVNAEGFREILGICEGAKEDKSGWSAFLRHLVDRGLIRIIDLLFVRKTDDGVVQAVAIADLDGDGELDLAVFEGASSGLLGEDDVEEAGKAMEPGSAAAILVYENVWAAPFASAVRRSGGQLVASGRIPVQALLAALDEAERDAGTDA